MTTADGTKIAERWAMVHEWANKWMPSFAEAIEELSAAEERERVLREAVQDAEHLCRWLLQSDISAADRSRVIRENGIAFALALATPAQPQTGGSK